MAALRACVENKPASVTRWNRAELLKDAFLESGNTSEHFAAAITRGRCCSSVV
jgi:hypothetical protein